MKSKQPGIGGRAVLDVDQERYPWQHSHQGGTVNLIYLHSHDTGRYIEPYGHAVPTPRLDGFAKESVLFRQAFCAGPTCSPSRAALLTGMCPHSAGMLGLINRGFSMPDCSRHLARYLGTQGYHTVLSGIQHVAPAATDIGYNEILSAQRHAGRSLAEWDRENATRAADWIRGRTKDDGPFFLVLGMFNTHREYPEAEEDPGYLMPPHPFPDTPETRYDFARYRASARVLDDCVAQALDALKDSGLADDTIVLYTTDHGIAFPEMKCSLRDTGIGVSLILRVPGQTPSVCDSLVSQIDLFPTFCDLLDVPRPDWLEGKSLVPVLRGEETEVRDEIMSEVSYHAAYEPKRCVRTKRYKLIRLFDDHDRHVPANIDDGPSKSLYLESGYLEQRRDKEMLFDLYLDPVERVNVINDPRYARARKDLSGRLEEWMKRTHDPILAGKIPKQEGARVSTPHATSPKEESWE